MGTEEPVINASDSESSANDGNANTTAQQQQQRMHLPKASPPPQVIIIPATNAAKKIRRAFSMPRNPFRWSRKFKTSNANASEDSGGGSNSAITSCVGGGRGRAGSIVSLSSYEAVSKDASGNAQRGGGAADMERQKPKEPSAKTQGSNGKQAAATETAVNAASNRVLRRSSFRKFLNRIAQHVTSSVNVGAGKHAAANSNAASAGIAAAASHAQMIRATDRVPPIGGYQWPADQTPGVMGLKNHGNTCFMNAVLQCLSHTDILAEYFVLDQYKADLKRRNKINSRKFGTKGELTEQLANVLKALWTCKNESDHSTAFKAVVDRYGSQFRSSTQHDAQEFLFWLLDKVHEDLNTATKRRYKSMKNSYGRPDEVIAAETLANHIRCNNSFVQAVFQAQFRSSLTCPRCKKQSNTFDPFHCVSVQLPQLTQQTIFVTVVYLKQQPRQVKLGLTVSAGSPIVALREQLQLDTGIASERMVLVDLNEEGFTRVFYDTQPVATLNGNDTIYCIEMPEVEPQPTHTVAPKVIESTGDGSILDPQSSLARGGHLSGQASEHAADLLLLVANVRKRQKTDEEEKSSEGVLFERFGTPFSMKAPRDCSYVELQKKLLRELSPVLKPEVFSYATPLDEMFRIRLQDPSADPDTYLESVEHPLLTEMIDLALSVLSAEAGPAHIKLLLEWSEPEQHFAVLTDSVLEHESVARLLASKPNDTAALTLEQCLEHYTKAETLSAEDAWRCPHCQQYLPVVKTLGLWSLPDILVVHFKRFRQHQEKGQNAAKLTTMVKFPLNAFDMSPHLARGMHEDMTANAQCGLSLNDSQFYRPSPWKKTRSSDGSRSSTLNSRDYREPLYDLYAVCYHQGDTLETGHYTAACKNPYDRLWYKFDDQRVSKVPNESIQEEIINNEAYMLFYQRRTGEAAECSGSSSNSGDHWVSRIAPPVPVVATAEKLGAVTDEQKMSKENLTTATEIEKSLEQAETKPVEIPKANETTQPAANEFAATAETVASMETLAEMVVKHKANGDRVDVDKIDFADADAAMDEAPNIGDVDVDALQALESLAGKDDEVPITEDANQIFVMDEECEISETKSLQQNVAATGTAEKLETSNGISNAIKSKTSPMLAAAAVAAAAVTTGTAIAIANGDYEREMCNSPTQPIVIAAPNERQLQVLAAVEGTTSPLSTSSSSSLSSRFSPHSLATSVHGASTLQRKLNGFAANAPAVATTTTSSSSNNSTYKEVLLSSSLKSNSSCVIGATAAAHSVHELQQLSLHQQHHWNGSRSSVSAVENVTQQTQQQTHCLNLRHSFSTSSSNYKLRECNETLSSMLRNSANTCSKDTLIFIDQQTHHHHRHHHSLMEDDDDTFMGSRSLWISPVTPHKLITVSPKN